MITKITNNMKNFNFISKTRWLMTIIAILTLGVGSVWATDDYEELFTIKSSTVVTNSSYAAYTKTIEGVGEDNDTTWVITYGGNNKSVGTNNNKRSNCNLSSYTKYAVNPVTTSSTASAFAVTTSISNVSKISYTINGGSNQTSTNVYVLYSSGNETFSQLTLSSGTQGSAISSGTAYEFSACSGYFALLFVATNTSGDWRIDDVDITFYKKNKASVTYNANGATSGDVPTDSNSPYTPNASVTVLGNTGNLVRTGCTFAGWNTKADGTGTDYAADASFNISGNTTLYAKWTATVTWKANGNIVRKDENIVIPAAGKSVALPDEPTGANRCGDRFMGWTTTENYKSNDAPGVLITEALTVTGNVTYYAVFADYAE